VPTLLAEARSAARTGVRLSLEGQGFTVCAEAEALRGAIDAAVRERPELCVIDVDLPGGGVAAAKEISTGLTRTVVMMSARPPTKSCSQQSGRAHWATSARTSTQKGCH
jgi:DNA-binding NarL/FixJ family response regulator